MTTELVAPDQQVLAGKRALKELKALVQSHPDKLMISGKQYLYFPDWQILGAFFGITASVVETAEITREKPALDGKFTLLEVIGFTARAIAMRDGKEVSAAEAECLFEEPNWAKKPRFQLRSMAQTRACAKALRNCLQWVVRLPDSDFGEEAAEEMEEVNLKQAGKDILGLWPEDSNIDMDWLRESLETLRARHLRAWYEENLLSYMKTTYKVTVETVLSAAEQLDKGQATHFCKAIQGALDKSNQ